MSIGGTQDAAFLAGGGDMGARMRALDWSATPLGPPAQWPQSLRTVLRLLLTTNHPMFVFWGPRHTCFYNDAYAASLGPEKHPAILGADGRGAWAEIWDIIGPQVDLVMRGDGATWHEDHLVPIIRHGGLQEVYWTYSYSPIDDDSANHRVGGVLVVCTETTAQVLARQAQAEETRRFAEMFEQAPIFIAMLDGPEHVFTLANAAYRRLTGNRPLLGKSLREALPEVEGQGELLDRVYATGEPFIGRGVEVELHRTSGGPAEQRVIDFIYQPILGQDGRARGVFVGGSDTTARARAEVAASAMAERLRLVQDAGAIGSFDWNLQTGEVYRSPEYLALHGLAGEAERRGYTDAWLERVHPEDRDRVAAEFARDVAGVGPFEREYRIIRPDTGETRWLLNRGRVTSDAQGRPARLLSAQTDITERKRMETALRDSEARFRTAADSSPAHMWMSDPAGNIVFANARYKAFLGVDSEALIADRWRARIHPDDAAAFDQAFAGDTAARRRFHRVVRVNHSAQGERWLSCDADPRFGADGAFLGYVGVNIDVTDAKLAEAALNDSRQWFQALADNIPTLCWMADPDGTIFWYNSRWYDYTGTSPDDQLGWGWESVHDPDVLPLVVERWKASLATGEPFEMTFPLRGADGEFRPFLTRVVPLRDDDGRIVRWFGANVDVSEQHRNQQHLRLMVNELNHRVKNTLATVQSITAQTVRGPEIPAAVRDTLTARLMALSEAHNVLTDEQWAGADLGEIAAQAAAPYQGREGDGRLVTQGPPVRLPPKTAIAVALALHELATNAAKYGALSTPEGQVSLTWDVADQATAPTLKMIWRESGGPPVRPPSRTGFGTRLIQRGLAVELNGRVELTYPPEGVVCAIEARLGPLAPPGVGEGFAVASETLP